MWFLSVDPDPPDPMTLESVRPGYRFDCPDVASVDRHLVELRRHVGPGSNLMPQCKAGAIQDIDRLLERRMYLMVVAL